MNAKPVTMYACGECKSKHTTEAEANGCCICKKCGERPVRRAPSWRSDKCERCFLKSTIRDYQERLRKEESGVESTKEHLAKLQAEYAALKLSEKAKVA